MSFTVYELFNGALFYVDDFRHVEDARERYFKDGEEGNERVYVCHENFGRPLKTDANPE